MQLNAAQIGFLRGIAYAVVMAVVAYLADPTHLTWLSGSAGTLIAALFASLDQYLEANGKGALFGVAR